MPKSVSLKSRFPGSPAARWGKMFGLSAVIGVLTGLAAAALRYGLDFGIEHLIGQHADLDGAGTWSFSWGVLLLPTVGGLLSGLLVYWLARKDDKHGTNQVIDAFHYRGGNLDVPGPSVKAVAAVAVISFGGSAGPEAPIAALGSSIGSKVARLLALTPHERRVMLIAGCAGGVGAVFQCPLGGALFATSVMYREPEFDGDSIVPAFVSSVLSYSTFITVMHGVGRHMLGGAGQLVFSHPLELVAYAILGPLCGLVSMFLYYCFRVVERRPLGSASLPKWILPAIGGLGVGVIGCVLPQVMAGHYGFVQSAMDGTLFKLPEGLNNSWWQWAALFGTIAIFKCVATALTVGSGASGGALGPTVFIGGAVGAFLGAVIHAVAPNAFGPVEMEALRSSLIPVGMAGVLAASMRTPMAAIVMVTEMTGSYGLIVPLMLVCVTAYVVGRRWGLNSAQVRSASESPAHAADLLVHTLQALRVRDVMVARWPHRVSASATLGEVIAGLRSGERPVFAVVDRDRAVGILSLGDISRVMSEPGISSLVIAQDIMAAQFTSIDPEEDLYEALEIFNKAGHDVLPVVEETGRFVGMLPRRAIHDTIRSRTSELRGHLQREHAGLVAVEQDEQLYQLMLGMSAQQPRSIQRMPVPYEVVGKSIRQSDFGREYNVQVVGILNPDGNLQCPPDIDAALKPDQLLVVIVAPQAQPADSVPAAPPN